MKYSIVLLKTMLPSISVAVTYEEGRQQVMVTPEQVLTTKSTASPTAPFKLPTLKDLEKVEERAYSGWSVYFDQDLLVGFLDLNSDRNYTMGLGVAHRGSAMKAEWNVPHTVLTSINKLWHPYQSLVGEEVNSFSYGITAFTPDDLLATDPVVDDRPYSSVLYFSAGKQQLSTPQGSQELFFLVDKVMQTQFTIALLGLNIGGAIQTELHSGFSKDRIPQGWGNQISDGGELTAKYDYIRRTVVPSLSTFEIDGSFSYDVSHRHKLEIGYYTGASLGFDFRFGKIRSGFWQHDSNPLSIANKNFSNKSERFLSHVDAYFWVSGTANVVAYNALLQGLFRDNPYELSSSQIERLVGEASTGYTHQWGRHRWTIAISARSSELDTTSEFDRTHSWGGIYYSKSLKP